MGGCPYSKLLGEPGKGIHERRIFGMALNDLLMTLVAALLTALVFKISIVFSVITWFTVGEILHYLFGVQTAFLTFVGIRAGCD
jgi:hypothetical protein